MRKDCTLVIAGEDCPAAGARPSHECLANGAYHICGPCCAGGGWIKPCLGGSLGAPASAWRGLRFLSACQWLLRLRALPTLSAGAYIYPYNDKDDKPVLPDEAPRENAGDGGAFSRGCRGHRPLKGLRLLAHRCTVSEATTCRAPAPTRQVVAVDAGRTERRVRRCRMRSR